MANYQVLYRGKWPIHDRDAEGIAMVVNKDGEYFQFVTAIISGIALITEHGSDSKRPEFWSGAARASVPLVKEALRQGRLPLDDPTSPFEIIPGSPLPLDSPALADQDTSSEDDSRVELLGVPVGCPSGDSSDRPDPLESGTDRCVTGDWWRR